MKKSNLLFLLLSLVIVQPVKAEDIQEDLCTTLKGYRSTPEECAKCPNREVDKWNYCMLKECPENHFRNADGTCLSCNTLEAPYPRVREDAECLKCSNRTMIRTKDMPAPECILKECPPNHVRFANGSCVSNQIFTESEVGIFKPMEPIKNNCTCSNCELFEGFCMWNNKQDYEFIAVKDTDPAYGGGSMVIRNCDQIVDYKTSKNQCNMCSNRYYKDGRCYLKKDTKIPMEEIPSDELATKRSEEYGRTFLRHVQNGKKCVCQAEYCENTTCVNWVKEYEGGKLRSYTAYDIKPFKNPYDDGIKKSDEELYIEEIRYEIRFYENGKIYSIGNSTSGVQYFDEKGNLEQKCDGFAEGLIGNITCEKYNKWKRKWIPHVKEWIT